jgi:uncharacterized membrane protein HdeD (DUF308 family)
VDTSTLAEMTTGSRNTLTRRAAASSDRHHWKIQLCEGVILALLGFVAVFVPFWFGATIVTWLILIAGITGLITTLIMWRARGSWWSLASAFLAIAIASVMIAIPDLAIVAFPLLLMTFLVLEGIVTILFALEHWREFSARWGWMLASGIVDLALAAFIVIGLPSTASWALGLILSVNLIFGGGAMIGMALAARTRMLPAHPATDVP